MDNIKVLFVQVCQSANPSLMTQHLLCQCLVCDIPACAVQELSQSVSHILGLKSVLALGFKVICYWYAINFDYSFLHYSIVFHNMLKIYLILWTYFINKHRRTFNF